MTATADAPPDLKARALALFSGKAIVWLSAFFGFPTGLLLLAHNWRLLGDRPRMARHLACALLSLVPLAIVAARLMGTVGLVLLLPANFLVLFVIIKRVQEMDRAAAAWREASVEDRNAWLGVGVGIGVVLALLLATTALLALVASESRVVAFDERDGRARWVATLGGTREADPLAATVANGRMFVWTVGREDERREYRKELIALDAATGRELWRFSPDRREYDFLSPYQTLFFERKLFADADTVYVQVVDGISALSLLAIDARSGTLRWSAPLGKPSGFSDQYLRIVQQGNELIFVSSTPTATRTGSATVATTALRAIDRRTSAATWRVELPLADARTEVGGPFADDGAIVVDLGREGLAAFALGTRTRLWTRSAAFRPLAVIGANLYGLASPPPGQNEAELIALDPSTGAQRWAARYTDRSDEDPIFDHDGAYMLQRTSDTQDNCVEEFVALRATDGGERWRVPSSVVSIHPPVRGEEVIVANVRALPCISGGTQPYSTVAYAPADGAERWRLTGEYYGDLTVGAGHVFALDTAPRWRNWLARLNPAWR